MNKQLFEQRRSKLYDFYDQNNYLPTYEKLKDLWGVSSRSTVHNYLQKFIEAGLVKKTEGGRLVPTDKMKQARYVGTIRAGFPGSADQEQENTMDLDEYLIEDPTSTFMLEVVSNSMEQEGIKQGDLVLVDRGKEPKIGDVVVARLDNEWTLKYFKQDGDRHYLGAASEDHEDIYPDPGQELKIGGVVTSVVRKYE
ncbi:MAG: LexA family protein [Candidatus Magasanikbacteria bacterium]